MLPNIAWLEPLKVYLSLWFVRGVWGCWWGDTTQSWSCPPEQLIFQRLFPHSQKFTADPTTLFQVYQHLFFPEVCTILLSKLSGLFRFRTDFSNCGALLSSLQLRCPPPSVSPKVLCHGYSRLLYVGLRSHRKDCSLLPARSFTITAS
jgi:hypothetical protein